MKLLPPACGQAHWFPVHSPYLAFPMEYEMTAVSKLFGAPLVYRIQEELAVAKAQDVFRTRLIEQLGTLA